MAKSKSFFGLRTGSTKSLTFQVYRGQQITKDRVYRVSNPRSEAQMQQRALIPIVAASRAAIKGLVDHSFEGVPYGEQSLKKFSELNLKAGALDVVSYSPNGVSNPGFAKLQVSAGSLALNCLSNIELSEYRSALVVKFNTLGKNELKFKAASAGDNADSILRAVADWGITDCADVTGGNQLTFLTVSDVGSVKVGSNNAPLATFDICRLLFPSAETTPSQISDVNGAFKVFDKVHEDASNVNLYNDVVKININYDHAAKIIKFLILPTKHPHSHVAGGTVIRSAMVNNVWKRSNSKIEFPDNFSLRSHYTYEMWRSYYESTGTSAKYLNQGNEGTGIG